MRAKTEICGCKIDACDRYVEMCPKHKSEHDEIHDRWVAQKRDMETRVAAGLKPFPDPLT